MHLKGQRLKSRSQYRFTKNILKVDFSIPTKALVVSIVTRQSSHVDRAKSASIVKRTYLPD